MSEDVRNPAPTTAGIVPPGASPQTGGATVTPALPDGGGGTTPLQPTATAGSGSHVGADVVVQGGSLTATVSAAADVVTTGTLTTATPGAGNTVTTGSLSGMGTVSFQLTGTWTCSNIVCERSVDAGTTWDRAYFYFESAAGVATGDNLQAAENGVVTISVGGTGLARLRVNGAITGTVVVTVRASVAVRSLATATDASVQAVTSAVTAVDGDVQVLQGQLPASLGAHGGLVIEGVASGTPVPVSAASLPLPTGAATAALQGAGLPAALSGTSHLAVTEDSAVNVLARLTTLLAQLPAALAAHGGLPIEGVASGVAVPVSMAAAPTGAAIEAGHLATIDTNTGRIPVQGQALAASSTPITPALLQATQSVGIPAIGVVVKASPGKAKFLLGINYTGATVYAQVFSLASGPPATGARPLFPHVAGVSSTVYPGTAGTISIGNGTDGAPCATAVFLVLSSTVNTYTPIAVTTGAVAAGSNGASLPQATINLVTTAGLPFAGTCTIAGTTGTITYTGSTTTTLTGCTGGSGTLATAQVVTPSGLGYDFTIYWE